MQVRRVFTRNPIKYFWTATRCIAFGAVFTSIYYVPSWIPLYDASLQTSVQTGLAVGILIALGACWLQWNLLSGVLIVAPGITAIITHSTNQELAVTFWLIGVQYGILWTHFVVYPLVEDIPVTE